MGDPVLPPRRLHPRLHHGAGAGGQAERRLHPTRRQNDRPVRRLPGGPSRLGQGHPGLQRRGVRLLAALPHHRGQQAGAGGGAGHAGPRREGPGRPAGHRPLRVRHRPRQEAQTVPPLPGDHRTQLRRNPAGGGLAPDHGDETGGDACRLEARGLRDGSPQHVRRGGRLSVPRRRLHQRAALREAVPALHAPAVTSQTGLERSGPERPFRGSLQINRKCMKKKLV